ncbi:MAG: cell division protein FtsA [Bacteroidales bacterium]|nr:cell division protein FtsA [Bacteroidales bacterium]
MTITNFIAAIELGSSKIRGMAGTRNSDGSINVLAYADEDSTDFIRKGIVYNLDKTSQALNNIINVLEGKLNESIAKVYIGVSGQSLRSVHNSISKEVLQEDKIIDQKLMDLLSDENLEIPLIDLDILEVAPQEYKIGNNLQIDPKGVATDHIEGRFLNIVANKELKKRIEYCFEEAQIEIAELLVSPLTSANVILSEKEKRAGCALIDFGANTTTVSIYRDNLLRFLTIIPLGGENITKDLMALQIEENEAEHIKLTIGNACLEKNGQENSDEEEKAKYTLEDGRKIDLEDILLAIEARMEEIVANVWHQIQVSGYDDKLLAGIILTGGASKIKNLRKLIQEKTTIVQVRRADNTLKIHTSNKEFVEEASKNTIIGLLYAGQENCRQIPVMKEPVDLFENDEDLKRQEEEAKKTAIEKEKKKQEEEARKAKERKKEKAKEKKNNWFSSLTETFFSDDDIQ